MEDLSNIVRVRRLTLAGHVLWLPSDRPASVAMQRLRDGGRRRRGRPSETCNKHSRKIYKRCESAGVVFVEWLVIRVCGKVSSPNALAGVGGSMSKYLSVNLIHLSNRTYFCCNFSPCSTFIGCISLLYIR